MRKNYSLVLKIIVVVSYFFLCFFVAGHLPPLRAPDEIARFQLSNFIYLHHHLPIGTEAVVRIPHWGFSYAMEPYLPSMLAVLVMKTIGTWFSFKVAIGSLLLSARMVSVLSAVGIMIFSYKIGSRIFNKLTPTLLFVAFSSFLPQIIFLGAYLNNDIFSIFSTYMIFYFLIRGQQTRWDWCSCVGLIISVSACILTYYSAYAFVLMAVMIYFIDHKVTEKDYLIKTVTIVGGVFTLSAWFFIRNYAHFGDFLGIKTTAEYYEKFGANVAHPGGQYFNNIIEMIFSNHSIFGPDPGWLVMTIKSAIGMFGFMEVRFANKIYLLYFLILIIGCILGLNSLIRHRNNFTVTQKFMFLFLTFCLALPFALSAYASYFRDYQAQGRYVLSALLPVMLLATEGYRWLASKTHQILLYLLTGGWVLLGLYLIKTYLFPILIP
ncbi:glycosyltransferase family 39 protein [Lactococcus fujiensis]|nr:glycosyltransferase family 39 protein [Lactococcus fujiensis]